MTTEAAPAAPEAATPAAEAAPSPVAEAPKEEAKANAESLKFWKEDGAKSAPVEAKPEPAAAEPAKEEPKPDPKAGELFARLTRMERDLQKSRAENEELKKRPAAEPLTIDNFWDIARKNNIAPQAAIDVLVKDPTKAKPPEDPEKLEMKRQVEELRKEAEARKAREAQASWDSAVEQAKGNLRGRIDAAKEKYELCAAEGDDAIESAWAIIEGRAKATGEIPNFDDVLSEMESAYETQTERRLTTKKALARMPKVSTPQQSASGRPPASGQRTLSNRATASSSARDVPENASDEELARLIRWNS